MISSRLCKSLFDLQSAFAELSAPPPPSILGPILGIFIRANVLKGQRVLVCTSHRFNSPG